MQSVNLPVGDISVYRWKWVPFWLLHVSKTTADVEGYEAHRYNVELFSRLRLAVYVTAVNGKTTRSIKIKR